MTWLADLLLFLLLWLGGYAVYLAFNHGVAPNARLQQLLRYLAAAACAVAPFVLTLTTPLQPSLLLILAVAVLWMVTYPLTYHLTHRKAAPDYDHQIDVAFGIYLFGWLATWLLLLPALAFVAGIVAFVLLFLLIAQWVYYAIYDVVIDATGLAPILETDYNEAIEYLRSYPLRRVVGIVLAVLLLAALCLYVPLRWRVMPATMAWWQQVLCAALFLFIALVVFLVFFFHVVFVRILFVGGFPFIFFQFFPIHAVLFFVDYFHIHFIVVFLFFRAFHRLLFLAMIITCYSILLHFSKKR